MSDNCVQYELANSMKRHIEATYYGAEFDNDGVETRPEIIPESFKPQLALTGLEYHLCPSYIVAGRFQDDPTDLANNRDIPSARIEISYGFPDKPQSWSDELTNTNPESGNAYAGLQSYLVGGAHRLYRKMSIYYEVFFTESNQLQDEANRLTTNFAAAMELITQSAHITNSPYSWAMNDESGSKIDGAFGEKPIECRIARSEYTERGGPESVTRGDYIWSGYIWYVITTERYN